MKPKVFLVTLGLLLTACTPVPEAYRPEPNIFCLLRTDQDRLIAYAGMSVEIEDSVSVRKGGGTAGVDFRIWRNADTMRLREMQDTAIRYQADSVRFLPGETWQLAAVYPQGKRVIGITRIPDSCPVIVPVIDTVYYQWEPGYRETLVRAILQRPVIAGAAAYRSLCNGFYQGTNDTMNARSWQGGWFTNTLTDTFSFYPRMTYFDTLTMMPDTMYITELRFTIWAIDTNACDYFVGDRQGKPVMHLDGGLGLFGSAAVTKFRIRLPARELFSKPGVQAPGKR